MKLRIIIKYIKTIQGWTISLNRFYLLCHRIYGLHRDQAPARELRYWLRLFLTHKTLGISSNKRSFLWRLHSLRHFCEHCCSLQAVRLFHCPGKKNFLSNLINFLFFLAFRWETLTIRMVRKSELNDSSDIPPTTETWLSKIMVSSSWAALSLWIASPSLFQ